MSCFRPARCAAVVVVALVLATGCTDAETAASGSTGSSGRDETERATTAELQSLAPALPGTALFATGSDLDQQVGLELIWIDDQHTLHAGSWAASIEVPSASPFFVNEQAELRALRVNEMPLIVFVHPVEGVEDPANLYQLFAVTETGIDLVHKQVLGQSSRMVISGAGASYVESTEDACRRASQDEATPPVVTIDEVFLGPGPEGRWHETDRRATTATFDCRNLAG